MAPSAAISLAPGALKGEGLAVPTAGDDPLAAMGRGLAWASLAVLVCGWVSAAAAQPHPEAAAPAVAPAAESPGDAAAVPPIIDLQALDQFEREVRPLLVGRCVECHAGDAPKGGLRVDSRAALLRGGDSGPALVPGQPEASLLIEAIRYGERVQMPPDGRLSAAEVAGLVRWIASGAVWPESASDRSEPAAATASSADAAHRATDTTWWSLLPRTEPTLPEVRDAAWPRSPLDRFVLARLEAAGLRPAPEADRRTLIRRLTFDLTGLPPTPEEVEQFLADTSPEAESHLIERLLASPQYGERWGRHWLDVARYSDSNGLDENLAYAEAYRYRDWVVEALNRDLPYDQFVREQLAGDLLPSTGDEQTDLGRLVATGFLCLGAKMLAEDDPVKMEMDIVDEQVDTLGQAFLGMTLGCARCHDHKFDPVSLEDYYALAGVLKSTRTMETFTVVARWHERPILTAAQAAEVAAHDARRLAADEALRRTVDAAAAQARAEVLSHLADYLLAADRLRRTTIVSRLADPSVSAPPGTVLVEAERFTQGNVKIDFVDYGPEIGVIYDQGTRPNVAEYELDLPQGGVYQIELRYAAAEARPVKVLVDGQFLGELAEKATGSWHPDTQTWHAETAVELSAGVHRLRIERAGPFPHFDKLALVPLEGAPGSARDPAADEPTSPPVTLIRGFIERWATAMSATGPSPLEAWSRWTPPGGTGSSEPLAVEADSAAHPVTRWVLRAPQPASRRELAERFAELHRWSVAAESSTAPGPEAVTAKVSPTEALAAWRQLLAEPAGPLALDEDSDWAFPPRTALEVARLREELSAVKSAAPAKPQALAVAEGTPQNLKIHIRGSHWNQGHESPRRFPAALGGDWAEAVPPAQSGRLELARWITDPRHPLTARVIVNRVWRWHFGQGLVRSTDNFGHLGDTPSHPELLDWLANRLIQSGWSLKALHRLILDSATYRQSTRYDTTAATQDPDNRLRWRFDRRRLEAEEIRDALLAVSGQLDPARGGTLLTTANRAYVASTNSVDLTNYASHRRSLYLPVVRSALYDVFQAFDFAEPSVLSGDRPSTTVAPQALFVLNSSLVHQASGALAEALLAHAEWSDAARVTAAFQRAFGRPATADEVSQALTWLAGSTNGLAGQRPAENRRAAWQALCRVILGSNEFFYVD